MKTLLTDKRDQKTIGSTMELATMGIPFLLTPRSHKRYRIKLDITTCPPLDNFLPLLSLPRIRRIFEIKSNEQTQSLPTLSLANKRDGGQGPLMKSDQRKDLIKILHRMLIILGYNVDSDIEYDVTKQNHVIGNSFAKATEFAVREFQEENRDWNGTPLSTDGLVGPKTADALNRAMVGVFYPVYRTPDKLTSYTPVITITRLELKKNGVSITPEEKSSRARIYVVPPPFSVEFTLVDFRNFSVPEVEYAIEKDGHKITGKSDSKGQIVCNDLMTNNFKLVLSSPSVLAAPASPSPSPPTPVKLTKINVKIMMDYRSVNSELWIKHDKRYQKVILPGKLQDMLVKKVADKFAPLSDKSTVSLYTDPVSVSVGWGEFTKRELQIIGNIQVYLTPGVKGPRELVMWEILNGRYGWGLPEAQALATTSVYGKDAAISKESRETVGGYHIPHYSPGSATITGANFVYVPQIFRDRIIRYNSRDATQFWKTPAELTIAYLAKSVAHEVGHALGIDADGHTDLIVDLGLDRKGNPIKGKIPGGTIMDTRYVSDDEFTFDWPENDGPKNELEDRRNYAILAIHHGVTFEANLVKAAAGDQIKLNQLINTLQGMSDEPVEVRPSGAVYWNPSPDKMKFTQEQIQRMRYSVNPLPPWTF